MCHVKDVVFSLLEVHVFQVDETQWDKVRI